jgi:hypothetical protein
MHHGSHQYANDMGAERVHSVTHSEVIPESSVASETNPGNTTRR